MVYNNNLIACIKVDGKVLREKNSSVELPFGTEYTIMLKNLNSKRAVVNIEIDGQDIGNGDRLVINPNESLNLERYITSNHRFKFIEKTEEISDYRGDRPDDGLIRISYSFEKDKPNYWNPFDLWFPQWYKFSEVIYDTHTNTPASKSGWVSCDSNVNCDSGEWTTQNCVYRNESNSDNKVNLNCINNSGITVPGSKSNQQFEHINNIETENEIHVIVLSLVGCKKQNDQIVTVQRPILVQTKLTCPTCGKKCPSNDNFCPRCGTALN